ncbi:MAG TPA: putative 2-dehydropantoate 2-reductase [Gammaproteobacteria bacterium]|nr:putative 2-dehydropantoate 2-reductase [Gammaproteobacteria bacterium]
MTEQQQPRIGILGTGAIGGFYGLMLARAGFDVHFLLRSEYAAVSRNGLRVESAVHGELRLPQPQTYHDPAQMPACDWLLVCAKATSNAELAPLINQVTAPGAKVVLLQNGLGAEDELRPFLDEHLHLLGGLCFIYINRTAPGVIEHHASGVINLGYHSGGATAEEGYAIAQQGAEFFQQSGLTSKALRQLEQARWQKLVWNIPYNGLSVLLNSDTAQLMAEPHSRTLIADLMDEVVVAAAACGYPLADNFSSAVLKSTESMPAYFPSMYHDFRQKREMELEAIYRAPLKAAQAAGYEMPKVKMLLQMLEYLSV